jgi:hypothetical protein
MSNKNITPYKTKSGLEIGKHYQPTKTEDTNYDMDLIQDAFLSDPYEKRREKIFTYLYFAITAIAAFCLLFFW